MCLAPSLSSFPLKVNDLFVIQRKQLPPRVRTHDASAPAARTSCLTVEDEAQPLTRRRLGGGWAGGRRCVGRGPSPHPVHLRPRGSSNPCRLKSGHMLGLRLKSNLMVSRGQDTSLGSTDGPCSIFLENLILDRHLGKRKDTHRSRETVLTNGL